MHLKADWLQASGKHSGHCVPCVKRQNRPLGAWENTTDFRDTELLIMTSVL